MPESMNEAEVIQYITDAIDGVDSVEASGDRFFFYDPGRGLPVDQRFPFATLVTDDNYEDVSNLKRPGVYRLNVGVSRETFRALFGEEGSSANADGDADTTYDFTALDRLMPHPVYGNMHWVCVLNPSPETFERVKPLLAEAYERSATTYARSHPTNEPPA
jgi:hypothetical protein